MSSDTATAELQALALIVVLSVSQAATAQIVHRDDTSRDDLPRLRQVARHGITWTFDREMPVGRFVNGDWYVVGPVTVSAIDPAPANGRNGSGLNVSARDDKCGFDDRIPFGRYDPALFRAPPIELRPGDTLISTISLDALPPPPPMLWRQGRDQRSPLRAAATLTCLPAPVPPDAFRPAYNGKDPTLRRARQLRRDLLPNLPRDGIPLRCHTGAGDRDFTPADAARWFERPWLDLVLDEFGAPVENMPVYGREFARAVGMASLLLCLDLPAEEKEPILIGLVQVGIDLWGLAQDGQPATWRPLGGHGIGRKWPIVFAGWMLEDPRMQSPTKTLPDLIFSEDWQTMFDDSWTGARVVYAGHAGREGHPRHAGWGRYEHLPPEQWEFNAESWRRCCTSSAWVAQALAARLLRLEARWNHDAFFAYADRWMFEDDTAFVARIRAAKGWDFSAAWARQGSTYDPFTRAMWQQYRMSPGMPPADDWRQKQEL